MNRAALIDRYYAEYQAHCREISKSPHEDFIDVIIFSQVKLPTFTEWLGEKLETDATEARPRRADAHAAQAHKQEASRRHACLPRREGRPA